MDGCERLGPLFSRTDTKESVGSPVELSKSRTISHSRVQADNNLHRPTCRQCEPMNYRSFIVLPMKVVWLGFLPTSTLSDHGNVFTKVRVRGGVEGWTWTPSPGCELHSARATSPRLTEQQESKLYSNSEYKSFQNVSLAIFMLDIELPLTLILL
jgi:hypothetical protein